MFVDDLFKAFNRPDWRIVPGMRASTGLSRSFPLNNPSPKLLPVLAVKFDEIYYFANPAQL